jgi:hypothetical protein
MTRLLRAAALVALALLTLAVLLAPAARFAVEAMGWVW